jgi:aspartyl-tRNA synthetase
MVVEWIKYFKCFRDEDLRRQTTRVYSIDCEMAFVEQEDILNVFEGLKRRTKTQTPTTFISR